MNYAKNWKGPTVQEIAKLSGLGVATVDRVLNGRPGVRQKTRDRVQATLKKLQHNATAERILQISLVCDSGGTFNSALADAAIHTNRTLPGVSLLDTYSETNKFDAQAIANRIIEDAKRCDGLILVAREHPAINYAVRAIRKKGVPVVCLSTDLPSSRRNTYIGNDQYAAGSVAAKLIGQALPTSKQSILFAMSVPFRCQQEREMGFRRVLRSSYPHLHIEEKVICDDVPATTFEQLNSFFKTNGIPPAIYNVAGANRGVAKALAASSDAKKTIFVGHELTPNSQQLLLSGTMDYVISHDFYTEVQSAVQWIKSYHQGIEADAPSTPILLHTRYNCSM